MSRPSLRTLVGVMTMPAAVTMMFFAMPRLTGAGWGVTTDRVEDVPLTLISLLVAVWAAGLWLHTLVLRASLPGLGMRRALALNLGGSSVSNVLPFGGAAGVGLNYAMLRSWGYSGVEISAFATISNVVVAVVKVLIALTGLMVLLMLPSHAPVSIGPSWSVSAGMVVIAAPVLACLALLLLSKRSRARLRLLRSASRQSMDLIVTGMRRGWHLITVGGVGYPALQALLLWLCLRAVGAPVSLAVALTVYAVERLLTLVPFTPGGVGVVEAGATATLVALGVDPAGATGGVILFRLFTFFIEIPLGGLTVMCWLARRKAPSAGTPATA